MAILNTDAPGDNTETAIRFYCTPMTGYTPAQVTQWLETMPKMIAMLKGLDIEFLHNPDGSFYRTTGFGQPGRWWTHNQQRQIHQTPSGGGLVGSRGVDVLEYFQCTRLLVREGRIIGAAGFNVLDGSFHIIHATRRSAGPGQAGGPCNRQFLTTSLQHSLAKYHPMMEMGPRYLVVQGTARELAEDNGPPFELDLTHIPPDIFHHLQYEQHARRQRNLERLLRAGGH